MAKIKLITLKETIEKDRLEAEFFISVSRMKSNFVIGEKIIEFVQYGTSEELNEEKEGYPILRLNEFDGDFISEPVKFTKRIDKEKFENLKLKAGDVLICRTNGNPKLVGKSAIVMEDKDFAFASYLFRIRPKKEIINAETLLVFLNSKIGREEIEKHLMISNQSNFSPAKFREIKIPLIPQKNQWQIKELIMKAYKLHERSKKLYGEANFIFSKEVNPTNYKSKRVLTFNNQYSKLSQSNRFDAEYYQPKYKKTEELIEKYQEGSTLLSEVIIIRDDNINPEKNESYKYIELANVLENGEISGFIKENGGKLPSRARRQVFEGDIIISTIEGSLSSCALITKEYDKALCSTGFFVINSNSINSETLLIMFKSGLFQDLLKKGCSGTILTAIGKDEFNKIRIPLVKREIQKKIAEKIKEAFRLRKEAKALLEEAKEKVEEVILN